MTTITITLHDEDLRKGTVTVLTTEPAPQVGRSLTPAQALAMDLLRTAQARARHVEYDFPLGNLVQAQQRDHHL